MKKRIISLFFGVILCVVVVISTAVAEPESEKVFVVQPKILSIFDQGAIFPRHNANNFDKNGYIMIIGYNISANTKFGVFAKPSVIEDRSIKTPGGGIGLSISF